MPIFVFHVHYFLLSRPWSGVCSLPRSNCQNALPTNLGLPLLLHANSVRTIQHGNQTIIKLICVVTYCTIYWLNQFRSFKLHIITLGHIKKNPEILINCFYVMKVYERIYPLQFAMVEAIISALADEYPGVLRRHKSILTFVVCLLLFFAGLALVTNVRFHI